MEITLDLSILSLSLSLSLSHIVSFRSLALPPSLFLHLSFSLARTEWEKMAQRTVRAPFLPLRSDVEPRLGDDSLPSELEIWNEGPDAYGDTFARF